MNDDKNKGSLFPISGVVIILAALGVTMFGQPFKSSRPFVSEHRESYEQVSARLWQDPFHAILDSVKDGREPQSDRQCRIAFDGEQQLSMPSKDLKKIKGRKEVTILGVMVPGQPYFEDTETRMRYRYAVLSGLSRVGFIPEDPEHIQFIRFNKIGSSQEITLSNIMPFEWLTYKGKEENSVLVVWINDSVFQDELISNLDRLFKILKGSDESKQRKVEFKIIGPADSTTLKKMVDEVSKDSNQKKRDIWLKIYSAMATIDNIFLLKNNNEDNDLAAREIEEKFRKEGIEFERTIGTDGELARALVKELRLRKVDIKDTETHLVLIAEWDTNYGRSFPDVFINALKEDVPRADKKEIAQRVDRIGYMRGIDGSLPGEREVKQKEDQKNEKAGAKSDPLTDVKKLEQPVGKSQYDYLRRLAEEAYNLDQELKQKGERIKAIGVMGTDFYDKYLVLQALRPRFLDAIFFTTDLDARMLYPDNFKWTRNLVVASNFNLSLRKDHGVDIQGEVPPFRDNYPTSVFLAVLRAFADERYLDSTANDRTVKYLINESIEEPQPLIFEIGRHNPILLTPLPENTIHPREYQQNIWFYVKIIVIVLFIFCILFLISIRLNHYIRHFFSDKNTYRVGISLFLIIIAFALSILLISKMEKEEPFSILEGMSVWPTEIFRFLAFLLSLFFIHRMYKVHKENKGHICDEFIHLKKPDPPKNRIYAMVFEWIRNVVKLNFWKNVAQINWEPPKTGKEVYLQSLWIEYVNRDSDQYHFGRVIILFIFHFLLCFLILSFDWPIAPLRGQISYKMDSVILFSSVISFIVLTFYVFDLTRCCRKFIDIASEKLLGKEINPPFREKKEIQEREIQREIENQSALVRLIAVRTETIGKFIFYPFIVLFVMFVARFDYFDNWRTPPGLILVIFLAAFYAWICAFLLRQSAERARDRVIKRFKELLSFAHEIQSQDTIRQIEFVLDEVKSIRQGAFASFTQHPVLQSLLVPSSGVGGIYLFDFISKMT